MNKIMTPVGITPLPLSSRAGKIPRHGFGSLRPATRWQDAMISGNGTIETKTFGHPRNETVIFTHEEILEPQLPDGVAYPHTPPEIAGVLGDVKKSLLSGDYERATNIAFKAMNESGYTFGIMNSVRRDAFVMHINTDAKGDVSDYMRTLDFRTGECIVSWTDDYGAWERRSFVSRPDGVTVQRITLPPEFTGSATIRITRDRPAERNAPQRTHRRRKTEIQLQTIYDENTIFVEGLCTTPAGSGYGAAIRIITDGNITADSGSVNITNARRITLLSGIDWQMDYSSSVVDEICGRIQTLDGYDELFGAHEVLHSQYFDRVSLNLAEKDDILLTAEELLAKEHLSEGLCLALVEKIFDMGRYFLIFSHGRTPYVWGHVNINVNLQVSSGIQGALPEMMETYFSWIEGLMDDWRENARAIFGSKGVLASAHPDALNGVLFHTSPGWPHHYWVAGAGWCYQPFWEYYQATGDMQFAESRILPGLRQVADFFDDYLIQTDNEGNYIFAPSYSPENWPLNLEPDQCVVINSVMDISVCREVLTNLLELCDTFAVKDPAIPRWREILAHLPPYLTDDLGALKEWAWHGLEERYDHRHVSHLYGAWPGDEIRQDIDLTLAEAALMANRKRAQGNASIHGIMHRALAAARLRDPFLAGGNLKQVLDQGYLNPGSMMTNHNPYRLYCPDACGSLPVLIIEMIIYSRPGIIELLPALPASLPHGTLKGAWTRTRAVIERLSWDTSNNWCELTIRSLVDQRLELRPPRGSKRDSEIAQLTAGEEITRGYEIRSAI